MKHLANGVCTLLILLLVTSCGAPPESGNGTSGQGSHITDSTAQGGPASGGKSHPYSEKDNLVDPNDYEDLTSLTPNAPNPFNADFIRNRGITRMQIDRYSNSENKLSEDVRPEALQITTRRVYEFDREGLLSIYDIEHFADLESLTKTTVANEYDFHRNMSKQIIRENLGNKEKNREVRFTYDEQNRLIAREDSLGPDEYHGYDDEKEQHYKTIVLPGGVVMVEVNGQPGDFPDEAALEIQDAILTLSPEYADFIPYDKLPSLIREINFQEHEERKIVRHIRMGANGVIEGVTDRSYNEFNNLLQVNYLWDDPTALFRSQTVLRYNPGHDLIKIVSKRARHQRETTTKVVNISYGPEGRLEKMVTTTRKDNGPEVIEAIDFVSYQKSDVQPQPGEAVPGGSGQ